MKRRDFLQNTIAFAAFSPLPKLPSGISLDLNHDSADIEKLPVPSQGPIPVAFVLSERAVVIDFCGPWEVFQDVMVPGRNSSPFELYTVAESVKPVNATAGLKIVPDYTFDNAPQPKIIVIPGQRGQTDAMLKWIRTASQGADLTMSVCVGANVLANTGLLSGRPATIHHNSYGVFAAKYPDIQLKRGVRFVDDGNIATSGGLSSGIDLALHVVERYFGTEVVKNTVYYMEYLGEGWKDPASNSIYLTKQSSSNAQPKCAVCSMDVNVATAPKTTYKDVTYFFCSLDHKQQFEKNPAAFVGS